MRTYNFAPTSRYFGILTTTMETEDGRKAVYLRRRFLPPPENFELLYLHTVMENDRLDLLANTYFSDPEAFWRIADANGAMRPNELTETVGRMLRITLPEGIPGIPNANSVRPDELLDMTRHTVPVQLPNGISGVSNA